ncbi:hypothetical protein ABNM01_14785, partial [Pseudomonas syringae]
ATSYKLQATSYKLQATSYKLQATSYTASSDSLLPGAFFCVPTHICKRLGTDSAANFKSLQPEIRGE